MDRYMGFTRDELSAYLDYNPVSGRFIRKRDNHRLTDYRYDCRNPQGKRISLYLNRVAIFLVDGRVVKPDELVRFKDSNEYNLAYDNLVVVKKSEDNKITDEYKFVETATKGVFFNQTTGVYVVRRGPQQAIYRTDSYKEAISIRKEWEQDKTIHRWDKTTPKWFISYLNEEKMHEM